MISFCDVCVERKNHFRNVFVCACRLAALMTSQTHCGNQRVPNKKRRRTRQLSINCADKESSVKVVTKLYNKRSCAWEKTKEGE